MRKAILKYYPHRIFPPGALMNTQAGEFHCYLVRESLVRGIGLTVFHENGPLQVINGIWLVALTAMSSLFIANLAPIKAAGLSSLLIAILIGIFYGNTLSSHLPASWAKGVRFCTKEVLRLAIILLGFNFTFQQIASSGMHGVMVDIVIVVSCLTIGYFVGTKLLKMDADLALICSVGPAICGASAVLAAETVLRTSHAKTAVAVSTVVLFGTISMFLYPFIYTYLPHNLSDTAFGIYIGATIHEVPQVVAAGNVINADVAQTSIIVKMARVLLLVPALFILGIIWKKIRQPSPYDEQRSNNGVVPWWAFVFVAAVALNSMVSMPKPVLAAIHELDVFLLTMAMGAIGMETTYGKFKQVGPKPFLLALILFFWLVGGGWALAYFT